MHGERLSPAEYPGQSIANSGDGRVAKATVNPEFSGVDGPEPHPYSTFHTDLRDPELWGLCVVGLMLLLFT